MLTRRNLLRLCVDSHLRTQSFELDTPTTRSSNSTSPSPGTITRQSSLDSWESSFLSKASAGPPPTRLPPSPPLSEFETRILEPILEDSPDSPPNSGGKTASVPVSSTQFLLPPSPPLLALEPLAFEPIEEGSSVYSDESSEDSNYLSPLLFDSTPADPETLSECSSSSFQDSVFLVAWECGRAGLVTPSPRNHSVEYSDCSRVTVAESEGAPSTPTMASLNPNSAYRLTGQRSVTQEQAKEQQKIIEQKLSRAGQASPPYDFIDLIGKGSFGRVYLGMDLRNSQLVALKVMEADMSDYSDSLIQNRDQTIKDFRNEVGVLQKLRGLETPNVNKIFDSFLVYDQLWIVAEYCAGGSVHTLMQAQNQKLGERYIIPIIREVARGLAGIHEAGIIHRDLKAANVMITDTGDVQIIDFGVAAELEGYKDKRTTVMGTLNWMAPEMHKRDITGLQYGVEVDIWSIGCVVFEMVKGRPPLAGKRPEMMSVELRRSPPRLSPDDGISEELCEFAEFILQTKPTSRPSARNILDHPYLVGTDQTHPTSILLDLVSDFSRWYSQGGTRQSLMLGHGAAAPQNPAVSPASVGNDDDWRFSRAVDPEEFQKLQQQVASGSNSRMTQPLRRTPSIKVDAVEESSYDSESRYLLQPNVYTPGASPRSPSGLYQTSPPAMSPDDLQTPTAPISSLMESNPEAGIQRRATEPVIVDDLAAQRGGSQLASIFNESKKPYQYGDDPKHTGKPSLDRTQSDLPLRNVATSSDVRSKEVFAPDPSKPRLIAPGSIPDISSIDINTIKQNRIASKSAGASPYTSESSGDENYESSQEGPPRVKRDTMAWTPDWGNVTPSEDDTYTDPDPFAQFGYQMSGSSLAPPRRPSLTQSSSAPSQIPQIGSRASTASVMDLDALMGDLGTPAPMSATPTMGVPNFAPHTMSEPAASPAPISPLPPPPDSESPDAPPEMPYHGTFDPESHLRPSLGHVVPPAPEAMMNDTSNEVMEAELERLLSSWDAELGDLAAEYAKIGSYDGPEDNLHELGEEADEEGDGE